MNSGTLTPKTLTFSTWRIVKREGDVWKRFLSSQGWIIQMGEGLRKRFKSTGRSNIKTLSKSLPHLNNPSPGTWKRFQTSTSLLIILHVENVNVIGVYVPEFNNRSCAISQVSCNWTHMFMMINPHALSKFRNANQLHSQIIAPF